MLVEEIRLQRRNVFSLVVHDRLEGQRWLVQRTYRDFQRLHVAYKRVLALNSASINVVGVDVGAFSLPSNNDNDDNRYELSRYLSLVFQSFAYMKRKFRDTQLTLRGECILRGFLGSKDVESGHWKANAKKRTVFSVLNCIY